MFPDVPTDSYWRIRCNAALAGYLGAHFRSGGDGSLLDEAIISQRDILASWYPVHPGCPLLCHKLSVFLEHHFLRTKNCAVLHEAVCYGREALTLARQGSIPYVAKFYITLALQLAICGWQRCADCGGVQLCIMHNPEIMLLIKEALASTPIGHPERWRTL